MEEVVERDHKRMETRMLWLAVLMLALLALSFTLMLSPALDWMESTWGPMRHTLSQRCRQSSDS